MAPDAASALGHLGSETRKVYLRTKSLSEEHKNHSGTGKRKSYDSLYCRDQRG